MHRKYKSLMPIRLSQINKRKTDYVKRMKKDKIIKKY